MYDFCYLEKCKVTYSFRIQIPSAMGYFAVISRVLTPGMSFSSCLDASGTTKIK